MTIHIGEIASEVTPEPQAAAEGGASSDGWVWEELDRWAALRARATRDAARTAAEGFDD